MRWVLTAEAQGLAAQMWVPAVKAVMFEFGSGGCQGCLAWMWEWGLSGLSYHNVRAGAVRTVLLRCVSGRAKAVLMGSGLSC